LDTPARIHTLSGMRRLLAALLTLAGTVGVVFATMRPWQGDRTALDLALRDVFTTGEDVGGANLFTSLALPMLVGALVGLLGMLVRARVPLLLAFVACLVPTGMWALQARVGTFEIPDLRMGFTYAVAATAAFLLAALVLPGPQRAAAPAPADESPKKGRWPLKPLD